MSVAAAALLTVVTLAQDRPFDSLALAQDRPQGTPPQPAPPQTGLILGRVVDAASGRPIAGAIVSLEGGMLAAGPAGGGGLPRAITSGNGQFVFRRLPKGTFGLTRTSLSDVVVTFTDRPSDLSGKVLASAGAPPPDCYVILYSVDRTAWYPQSRRILTSRPASDGAYMMRNVIPGEYFLAAVEDVESSEWFDPEFLQRIMPIATTITIGEGEKKVQNLKTGGGG